MRCAPRGPRGAATGWRATRPRTPAPGARAGPVRSAGPDAAREPPPSAHPPGARPHDLGCAAPPPARAGIRISTWHTLATPPATTAPAGRCRLAWSCLPCYQGVSPRPTQHLVEAFDGTPVPRQGCDIVCVESHHLDFIEPCG